MTPRFKMLGFHSGALLLSALLMTSAAAMTSAAPLASQASVGIGNFSFQSSLLTVKAGTTVTWTNGDDIPHTIVSKDGLFRSKVLDTGERFSFTFAKPGQFGYFCSLHPHMTGTIVVKA